jgi:Ca-activated chloride channel homolog
MGPSEVVVMFAGPKSFDFARRLLILAASVSVSVRPPVAHAQTELSDIHVEPRVQATLKSGLSNRDLTTIRTHSELVLVPVTVTDPKNRVVVGLGQENFQLYEGKQSQEIKHFSREDAPVSLGVILDVSGSMATKIERAREAVLKLLEASNPQDEFFLITFSDIPNMVQTFTRTIGDMQEQLLLVRPKGQTALLDAIYMGLNKMHEAKYARKALLLISDGGDNHSRFTEKEVKSRIKESDVLVYSVGVFDREFATREERLGPELLTEISEVTGGQCYTLENPNYLPTITEHIGLELRNQYVLAYSPNRSKNDGKWRKINVKLTQLPKRVPQLYVHARGGYYKRSE